jgi:hypothetical protein
MASIQNSLQPTFQIGELARRTALTHVIQQARKPPLANRIQRQAQASAAPAVSLPAELQSLTAAEKQVFRQFIVTGNVQLQPNPARLTGDRDHDSTVLAEYFLCARSLRFENSFRRES